MRDVVLAGVLQAEPDPLAVVTPSGRSGIPVELHREHAVTRKLAVDLGYHDTALLAKYLPHAVGAVCLAPKVEFEAEMLGQLLEER